jgi:glycyl-tRNA synthetase
MNSKPEALTMETLVSLAKRRGFIFQSSEIYGGLAGFWDYGPYGTELVRNIRESWWRAFVYAQPNVVGLDTTIIQNPKLWQASGHVDTFVDPMVDCKNCNHRFRADHVAGFETKDLSKYDEKLAATKCPNCGKVGEFTPARHFNMMFKTYVGPIDDEDHLAYLRPETAGGIFAQFLNVLESSRQKIPFGIAQIGKAFRNEITPGDFIFRVRELEQMELEYFVKPDKAREEYARWKQYCMDWVLGLGLDKDKLRFYDHEKDERAHYAAESVDIQYEFPMGFKELYGIANRTDYDLTQQGKGSGKDLSYFDEATKTRFVPYVIEPSVGVGRLALALMHSAYTEEKVGEETRVVLRFNPEIAPVKVAVLPLSKNEQLVPLAREVFTMLAGKYRTEFDETQSIGRRYRRQDEIGTPLCVTVDFDSLEDKAVTVRHRDTMKQERVKIAKLPEAIENLLASF